jgi:preprotein translocase subunit Sec61beta
MRYFEVYDLRKIHPVIVLAIICFLIAGYVYEAAAASASSTG